MWCNNVLCFPPFLQCSHLSWFLCLHHVGGCRRQPGLSGGELSSMEERREGGRAGCHLQLKMKGYC